MQPLRVLKVLRLVSLTLIQMQFSSDVILLIMQVASATSQSFTLTTGVNTFTGGSGNDSFDASLQLTSLNDYDVLDGGAGVDTLTVKSASAAGG